jgi:hypothetical protein
LTGAVLAGYGRPEYNPGFARKLLEWGCAAMSFEFVRAPRLAVHFERLGGFFQPIFFW